MLSSSSARLPRTQQAYRKSLGLSHHQHYRGAPPSTCLLLGAKHDVYEEAFSDNNNGFERNTESSTSDATVKSISNPSLLELLAELDERDIRYPPSATRPELEQLLQRTKEAPVSSGTLSLQDLIDELERCDLRHPPTATRKELEMLLFGSKPTAEKTKPRHQQSSRNVNLAKTKSPTSSNDYIPLSDVLDELDKRNIRYSPTASRKELVSSLQQAKAREKQQASRSREAYVTFEHRSNAVKRKEGTSEAQERPLRQKPEECAEDVRASGSPLTSQGASRPRHLPLKVLLQKLDRLNVSYPATASRAELDVLLKEVLERRALHEERRQRRRRERAESEDTSIKNLLWKSTRVATKGVQRLPRKVSRIATSSDVTSRISRVAERAARKAKRVKRRASDWWNEDEDGIRDVDFDYVSIDRPIDVPAVTLDEDEVIRSSASPSQQRPPRRKPKQKAKSTRSAADQSGNGRQPDNTMPRQLRPRQAVDSTSQTPFYWQSGRTTNARRNNKRRVVRQKINESLGSSIFILPPSTQSTIYNANIGNATLAGEIHNRATMSDGGASATRRRPQQNSRDTSRKEKKVYSHYAYDEDGEIEGPFDIIREFLTNSADRLLWGPDNDSSDTQYPPSNQYKRETRGKQGVPEKARKPRTNRKKEQTPKYWKDRLAEQVDYALGIHEDGAYYNSWEKQFEKDQERIDREGPQFWERKDVSPRRRQASSKGNVKYKSPFWEEDGSILAFILGRTKSGEKLGVEVSLS